MKRTGTIMSLGMLASLLAFLACIALMGYRIADTNKALDKKNWYFSPIDARTFQFAGKPVTITDLDKGGVPHVRLSYAGRDTDLRVTIPGKYELPGLQKHADWLKVLRFADGTGLPELSVAARLEKGTIDERLAIVTRSLRPGVDPETWGQVYRSDWTFEIHELKPDGSLTTERLAYPMSERKRKRLGYDGPADSELQEGTWQYFAALHLMPKQGPTYQFQKSPVMGTGWTLPAAAFFGTAFLACMVALLSRKQATRKHETSSGGGPSGQATFAPASA